MDIKKLGIAHLFFLFLPVLVLGQRYDFKTISVNEGLPHGQVHHIHQTQDGYIWLATNGGGLVRYDGHNFATFTMQDGLQSNAVHRIFSDSDQNLWFSNDPGGLLTFKGDSLINPYPDAQISDYEVWSMEEVQGKSWFGTYQGGIFIKGDEEFQQLTTADGLINNSVWDIYEDTSGNIWVGTEEGVTVISDQDTTNYTIDDGLSGNRIYRIIEDDSGTIWIATNNGITRRHDERFESITEIKDVELNYIFDIKEASNGNIWIGTETKGVFVFDGESYTHFTRENGLSSNYTYYLFEDHNQTMWVATNENGVNLYNGDAFQFYDNDFGLVSNGVLSVFVDRDGIRWFGTQKGIQSFDGDRVVSHDLPREYENNYIWEIEQLPNGDMLFLMPDNTLMRYDGNKFSDFSSASNLGDLFIYDVFVDSSDQIWIGADTGLHLLKDDGVQTFTMEDGMAGNVVQHIYQGSKNNYYLSTTNGFSIFDGTDFRNLTIEDGLNNNTIHYATLGPKNNIWLGTSGGISVIKSGNPNKVEIDNFGKKHGMDLVATHFLWFDEQGYLWQGTNGGLNRLNVPQYNQTGQMELVRYGLSDKEMGIEFNSKAIDGEPGGNIWMGSMNGALKLDASKLKPSKTVPIPKLTNIEQNGKPVNWTTFVDQLQYKNGQLEFPSISFPPGEHSYTFSFVGINYRNPENIRYRFKVEGFEDEWMPVTSVNSATYTNLEPGDYTFKVQALPNGSGHSSDTVTASYPFSVDYPFWQTNWFMGLSIIGIVGLIYGYIKLRVGMLEKERLRYLVDEQTHHLQEALEEKEVLIKEIHHRVKNNLAVISGLLELQIGYANNPFVDRVLAESQRRVQSISMIHEKLYQNERLAEIDFEKYVRELVDIIAYSFSYSKKDIDVVIEVEDFKLGIDQGIPCGLILNELISNAFEHAFKEQKTGTIEINIERNRSTDAVQIMVRDDGIGVPEDFNIKQKDTLGITLIKTLVKQLEGELEIESTEGRGTCFQISFQKTPSPQQIPIEEK